VPLLAPGSRKARLGPGAEGVTNAGGIFKSAAVAILRQEKRLMTTGDITRWAAATPAMHAAIFGSSVRAARRPQRPTLLIAGRHCRLALERSLINCQGKTPEATMASALYTDVRKKGNASVFIRCAAPAARLPGQLNMAV
jgi:hypothetical protein